jgi:arylsulfatase A-like enzyme
VAAFRFAEGFLADRVRARKPFLLWVSPHQPHIPLKPPGKWRELYRPQDMPIAPNYREKPLNTSLTNQGKPGQISYRDGGGPPSRQKAQEVTALYYGVISHLDEQIGSLLEKLADLGLEEDTLVIFLSDNGYCLGNHGIGNKIVMFEESVRVPLLIRYPRAIRPAQVLDEMASSLDIMPTILDFCGLPIPDGLEGRSLKGLLTGKASRLRERVFGECCGVAGLGIGHRMVRTRRWKYMLSDVNAEGLFDLAHDPYELNNLSGDPGSAEPLRQLRRALAAWMDRVGDGHARPPNE